MNDEKTRMNEIDNGLRMTGERERERVQQIEIMKTNGMEKYTRICK